MHSLSRVALALLAVPAVLAAPAPAPANGDTVTVTVTVSQCSASASASTTRSLVCNADDCLRAMRATQTPGRLAAAQSFCSTYTQGLAGATPTYVPSQCNASRLSSACSCIATSTLPGSSSTSVSGSSSMSMSGSSSMSMSGSSSMSMSGGPSMTSMTSSSSASTTPTMANTNPTATATATSTATMGLNDYAKAAGLLYFGTAAEVPGPELNDVPYMTALNNSHEFGQLTATNYMKPFATEPERNVFNYSGGDVILSLAEANGQIARCHVLVWHNQLPGWLTSGTWDNATLIEIMTNHITNLVSHWGTQCYAWDVVNEAFEENGTLRHSIWYDTIGPAYIPIAFAAAEAAAPPGVKLYYNDYNIESPGPKATAAQELIASVKAQGIRVDGAGLQSHFVIGGTPSQASQEANMRAFGALGVEVAITELDIRAQTLPPSLAAQQQQKVDYYKTVAACLNVDACIGITLWDFVDTYSWIPSTFAGQGYGTPWLQPGGPGTALVKKIAYDGILEALQGVPVTRR